MTENLRVMAYNILFGGETSGQDRTGLIAAQVNDAQPDLLALCECWGFLENGGARRDAFCEAVGMHGEFVTAPSGNHVGLLYRPPWKPATTSVVAAPMFHGLVTMRVTGAGGHAITIHATHFNPYASLHRLMEAQIVFSRTRPGEPTIVMGDFNSLPPGYREDLPVRRLLDERLQPDTQVGRYFKEAGFVDVHASHGVTAPTYPTLLESKPDDFLGGVRLDYIMASRDLARACASAGVLDSPAAQMASDHLPVVADFVLE